MTKKLYKSSTDKALCGVCGGLGEYFEIDSLIVRLIFVAFSLAYGSGLLVYIIMALVIPKRPVFVQSEYTSAGTSAETTGQEHAETEFVDAEFKDTSSENAADNAQGYTASYSYTSTDNGPSETRSYDAPKVEVKPEESKRTNSGSKSGKQNKNMLGVLLIVVGGIIIVKEIFPVVKGSLLFAVAAILFGLYIIFRKEK